MATIFSHPAVPLAAAVALGSGVIPRRLLEFGMICSILPDLDVLAFNFGIPYEAVMGHRGFTHSVLFAVLVALVFRYGSTMGRERPWTTLLFLFGATISHGVLGPNTHVLASTQQIELVDLLLEMLPVEHMRHPSKCRETVKED